MGALVEAKGSADAIKSAVGGELLQLVTFNLGSEEYAVAILKVQEINRMKEITRVPNSPPYVEGDTCC